MGNTVHIGFGFHVNCYHSYRGDTNDEMGFGGDIRVIRQTIDTLDRWNERGIPVKGTWDFENAYSIEEILPEYAPDILERIHLRRESDGDEIILMGYNNGAMSAMTEDEFMASISMAVSNEKNSGLRDIFGDCSPIIRPQEAMFTPRQAGLYRKAGIEAVCLYYSCVPFDAFRSLLPQLADEQAYNPLRYVYNGESITILPMYSHADILDEKSLRRLVMRLHGLQKDVFLFINMDADSFLWEPLPIPKPLRKISCFDGLNGLIQEVAELDFVRFDTPYHYLTEHEPIGTITFGEDVADGNFSGYSSWAEKPFNRQIWTRIERSRMNARLYEDGSAPAFMERLRLLSTTHFGLASPVLNHTREQTALALSQKMCLKENAMLQARFEQKRHKQHEHEVWVKNVNPSSLVTMQLALEDGFCRDITKLAVKSKHLMKYLAVPCAYWENGYVKGIWLECRFEQVKKKYKIHFKITKNAAKTEMTGVCDKKLNIRRDANAMPLICDGNGRIVARWNSRVTYRHRTYFFEKPQWNRLELAGAGVGVSLSGAIHIDGELESGHYVFCFFAMQQETGIRLMTQIQYPYTKEKDVALSTAFNFARGYDGAWQEVIPMELVMELGYDAVVEKRDFMGGYSEYELADFERAFPQNSELDSFNHHLTGGILNVHDAQKGLILAHARQVLGSMAHCPMRLHKKEHGYQLSLNPFGTYFGRQRYYPTRGNGCMTRVYETFMPQARSLAPAYNGVYECAFQLIAEYGAPKRSLEAWADGCVVYATNGAIHRWDGDNVTLHAHTELGGQKQKAHLAGALNKGRLETLKTAIAFIRNQFT